MFYALSALFLTGLLGNALSGVSESSSSLFSFIWNLRDAANFIVGVWFFSFGSTAYYFALYKNRMIPVWLSIWGGIGILLVFSTSLAVLIIGPPYTISGLLSLLALPIALQEIVLGIYLIVKGFQQEVKNDG